ncbi:hypothetical protein CIB84_005664 [Bambusicola thoracicus]|uniref:Lactate/malate dehydrogenase C-terminal domain-containing protein n=1 Tax=Bambusicola thoracicus TaxID=9083 RepID=A0A2P4T2I3_BAMTH|nr:hypothetical protein CIB84_005664 [Bambusicola thoracicus]
MLPAHAVATALRYWFHGSPPGEIVSMGILSEGQFCIPEGIVFSMPVRFQNGSWEVVTELEIDEKTQEVLGRLSYDLIQEKRVALKEIKEMHPYRADKIAAKKDVCQVDLIDVSLIQHVLSSEQKQREKQISLKVQQLSGMLKELFERARLEKPGQVDPRAAEFTLSLLEAMYDRSGTGYIKTRSAAAALIALSGDTLLAKYRAFFEFYAVPDGKKALITRSALRGLLTDLNQPFFSMQIPAAVGEGCTSSCVEIATHSCFHGVSEFQTSWEITLNVDDRLRLKGYHHVTYTSIYF